MCVCVCLSLSLSLSLWEGGRERERERKIKGEYLCVYSRPTQPRDLFMTSGISRSLDRLGWRNSKKTKCFLWLDCRSVSLMQFKDTDQHPEIKESTKKPHGSCFLYVKQRQGQGCIQQEMSMYYVNGGDSKSKTTQPAFFINLKVCILSVH